MSWTPAAAHSPRTTTRPSAPAAGVRLTRRGRLVVLLGLLTLLLAAFSLGRVGSQASPRSAAHTHAAAAQTTVRPGETLWSVAKRVAPGHDPRAVILRLRELNNLDSAGVQAGQLLLIPS